MQVIIVSAIEVGILFLFLTGKILVMGSTIEICASSHKNPTTGPNGSILTDLEEGPSTVINGTLGSERGGIQFLYNDKSNTTLDLMRAIVEQSQKSGILDRMAQCGATMHNMTEEQYECVNDLSAFSK